MTREGTPAKPKIIVITGIQGAGKSTIGRLLAERYERAAFVDADDLHCMVVSGQAWVTVSCPSL